MVDIHPKFSETYGSQKGQSIPSLATLGLCMFRLVLRFCYPVTTTPTLSIPGSTQQRAGEVASSHGWLQLSILADIHIATLQVYPVTIEDQRVYMCQAVTENNIILNQTISAMVFEEVWIATESMLSYEAWVCETVVLNCTALHHDLIIWSIGRHLVI